MEIKCPNCNQSYEVEESGIGQQVECTSCGKTFTIQPEPKKQPEKTKEPAKPQEPKEPLNFLGIPLTLRIDPDPATFQKPRTSAALEIIGCIDIAIAALTLIGGIADKDGVKIFGAAGILIGALILFGFAAIVQYTAETAFNTRQLLKDSRKK